MKIVVDSVMIHKLGKAYEGQQLFDTRRLASGVYLYHIVQAGKKVSEGKFIVTH